MKQKDQKRNSSPSVTRVVLLLAIIVVVSSLVTFLLLHFFNERPDEVKFIEYDYSVKERVGLVLDNDALHFGGGPPGARLQRSINLSTSKAARVHVSTDVESSLELFPD